MNAAILFAGFLLTFFLNLTGLELHQWIGLLIGLLAFYHLLGHKNWISAVASRFFTNTSPQARLFYLLDTALLAGFLSILISGITISSWLKLSLENYAAWRAIHLVASFATLGLTVLKIGLHWRWIASVSRTVFSAQHRRAPSGAALGGRRDFLKVMGVAGLASTFALLESAQALSSLVQADDEPATATPIPTTSMLEGISQAQSGTAIESTPASTPQAARAASVTPTPQAAPTGLPTLAPSPTSVPVQANTGASQAQTCALRCNRRCAYPGRCRRYTDSNGNGRCDLGECT